MPDQWDAAMVNMTNVETALGSDPEPRPNVTCNTLYVPSNLSLHPSLPVCTRQYPIPSINIKTQGGMLARR